MYSLETNSLTSNAKIGQCQKELDKIFLVLLFFFHYSMLARVHIVKYTIRAPCWNHVKGFILYIIILSRLYYFLNYIAKCEASNFIIQSKLLIFSLY